MDSQKLGAKGFSEGILERLKAGERPDYSNCPLDLTDAEKVEYESIVLLLAELSAKLEKSTNMGVRGLDLVLSAAVLAGINSLHSLKRLAMVIAEWSAHELIGRVTGAYSEKGVPREKKGNGDRPLMD